MMNIKNWFKPNDWTPVWTKTSYWVCEEISYLTGLKLISRKYVTYTIKQSDSRNEFRLVCKGTNYQMHDEYVNAINKLNELRGIKID